MKKTFQLFLCALILPVIALAQSTVTGKVTEAGSGLPAVGASILIKGSNSGTATNFEGDYTINNVPDGAVLVFSSLGFTTKEITFNGQTTLNVSLKEDTSQLDEIVLIGYGSTTEKNVTAAQTTVKAEEFNKGAIVSPGQLLAGKAAGVQVVAASGRPGDGPQIRVRAGSTLSATQDPLYVVDGIPLDQSNANLNTINPADIESYTILKDASATAIYGNRASNGVIIITTKSGKFSSDLNVGYDVQFAWNKPVQFIDVLNGDQFRTLINEQGSADDIALLGTANTDWQNQIYQTGTRAIHNITLSKGWDKTSLRTNIGYSNENGTLITSGYERLSMNTTAIQKLLKDDLKLTLNVQGAFENIRNADGGAIGSAIEFDPTQPVFDPNGPNGFFEYSGLGLAPRNPLGLLRSLEDLVDNNQIRSTLKAEYKIPGVERLTFTGTAGVDYNEFKTNTVRNANSGAALFTAGLRSSSRGQRLNQLLNGRLDYKKDFEKLDTKAEFTVGSSFQNFRRSGVNNNQTNTGAAIDPIESFNQNRLISLFGRATFDIMDTFVISGSISRDGTSRFSPENRWGTFGGASLAIKLGEKDFIKNSGFISNLKLRGGYGVTGQQDIGEDFLFIQRFTPGQDQASVQIGDNFFNTLRAQRTTNLRWEETAQYNAGIDFGFFNDVITGSIDGYYRETTDLLQNGPLPAGNLGNFGLQNIGSTLSRGIELGLSADIVNNDNFNWTLGGNLTFQEIEITNLSLGENDQPVPQTPVEGGFNNFVQEWAVGSDPSSFHVFRQVYDQDGNPLNNIFLDINGDNQITAADKVRYKKANPDAFFGITSNMNYKDFDFSFTFRGAVGGYNYNGVEASRANLNAVTENPEPWLNNSPGAILDTGFVVNNSNTIVSSHFIEQADFVRLDNASLGYTFKRDKTTIRTSITGTNLFVLTEYGGVDPEIAGGIDGNLFPRNRGVILGLNIQF